MLRAYLLGLNGMFAGSCQVGKVSWPGLISIKGRGELIAKPVIQQVGVLRWQQPPELAARQIHRPASTDPSVHSSRRSLSQDASFHM